MDNAQLNKLKERIPMVYGVFSDTKEYESFLNRLLDDSKAIALSLRFPYKDCSGVELPSRYENWQLRCCEELYNGIGNQGIKSYSENGLSWTRDSGYISNELRNEIEPLIGFIVEEE